MPSGITILLNASFRKRRTIPSVAMQIFILWSSEQGTSIDVTTLILGLMDEPSGMNVANLGYIVYWLGNATSTSPK